MKEVKVSNPLTMIAVFASLAEVISLGILPFSDNLTVAQVWFIVVFAVVYPVFMAGAFWLVLLLKPAHLFSPEEHEKGDSKYQANVLNYAADESSKTFLALQANADANGKLDEFYANIATFLDETYGIQDQPLAVMVDSSKKEMHGAILDYLKSEGWV